MGNPRSRWRRWVGKCPSGNRAGRREGRTRRGSRSWARLSDGGESESAGVRECRRSRRAGARSGVRDKQRGADFSGIGRRLSSHATLGGERGLKISTWADCAVVGGVDRSARGLCSFRGLRFANARVSGWVASTVVPPRAPQPDIPSGN